MWHRVVQLVVPHVCILIRCKSIYTKSGCTETNTRRHIDSTRGVYTYNDYNIKTSNPFDISVSYCACSESNISNNMFSKFL